jgi:hypothetical protein
VTAAPTTSGSRRLDTVVWISATLAAGSALMAVAHLGYGIPVLSALGPGGGRAVIPAAIAFAVAAVLQGATSLGIARRRAWGWPLGVLIAALMLVGAAMPFRGVVSAIAVVLAGAELALLLSGPARREMLPTGS